MRYMLKVLFLVLLLLGNLVPSSTPLSAEENGTVVYFYHPQCSGCAEIEDEGVFSTLEDEGIEIIRYNTGDEDDARRFLAYNETYDVKDEHRYTPIIFAGDEYFYGPDTIIEAVDDGELQNRADEALLDVPDEIINLEGWGGLGRVIVAGLLDGINPCAIAMLLMFISIIGFLKNRRTLIIVSTSYILGIFLTYFAIGLGLFWVMSEFQSTLDRFAHILYGVFGLLALTLFILTFRDFLVTRKKEYGKVFNQLPGRLKRWNQNVMARFSDVIKNEDNKGVRALYLGIIPFIIGIVIGITEAACTGQIYIMILLSIRTTEPVTGTLYLLVFNLLFILPLIVIAIIAVMTRNVMGVSDFFREKLPLIKLLTSIFFILMALYFILLVFDIRLFNLISWVI
ncbi:MAG: cytochrome c biogenesis CcdA family protein [Candidatus Izemoplasmataceae bacterium]